MPKKNGDPEVLRCSFCNKDQSDVRKLIAGPSVYICDDCIKQCNERLTRERVDSYHPRIRFIAVLGDMLSRQPNRGSYGASCLD